MNVQNFKKILAGVALALIVALPASAQLRGLTIVSEPNASVWIDDVNYGKTDASGKLALRTYVGGVHRLRVRADGFKQVSQTLTAAQKGELKIALVKSNDAAELAFQQAEAMSSIDRDKAIALYQKAVKLQPKYPEAYVGLARVLAGAGDLDEALAAIANARKSRPAYPEASAVEGRLHKDDGNEEKAIASFKRAIAEGKGFQPEAHTGLGLLYKEKAESFGTEGDYDSEKEYYILAAGELRKAAAQLAGSPDAVVVYQLLGDSYERAKNYLEANKIYEEYIRNFPDTDDVTTFKSFIVQNNKRIKEEQ